MRYNTSTFSTNSNNKATYVEGRLTWTTKDGSVHPLKNIRVDLYDEDLWILGEYIQTTYTDDNGYYRFTFIFSFSFKKSKIIILCRQRKER